MNILFRHLRLLFSVVFALCALATRAHADTVLYTDGPVNGNIGSTFISEGFQVEDSFTLSSASTLTSLTIGLFTVPTSPALTIDWAIVGSEGSQTPVCADCSGTAALTQVSVTPSTNYSEFGFVVLDDSFAVPDLSLSAGTYWLELQNVTVPATAYLYPGWDINSGPSMVWFNVGGDSSGANCNLPLGQCGESFTIYGTPSATPEPSSLALLGSGVLLLGAEVRRRYRTIR